MPATDAQATALGYALPKGTDSPRLGDDAIRQNAKASAGLIIDLQASSARRLVGTGSPVGAVTPTGPGIEYTDTAGTNGAWKWISTGTTNASWSVVFGDSGLRRIAPPATWVGEILVRRSGSLIAFCLNGFGAAVNGTGSSDPLVTLPSGFRPFSSINGPLRTGGSWNAYTSGVVTTDSSTASKTYQQFTWQTRDQWPTAIPGTPA